VRAVLAARAAARLAAEATASGGGATIEGAKAAESLAAKFSDSTYLHYTDTAGFDGIMTSNAIRANGRNQVFLTQEMVADPRHLMSCSLEIPPLSARERT
jgi:hypothetical protein